MWCGATLFLCPTRLIATADIRTAQDKYASGQGRNGSTTTRLVGTCWSSVFVPSDDDRMITVHDVPKPIASVHAHTASLVLTWIQQGQKINLRPPSPGRLSLTAVIFQQAE